MKASTFAVEPVKKRKNKQMDRAFPKNQRVKLQENNG